jgi:hypothetical protein
MDRTYPNPSDLRVILGLQRAAVHLAPLQPSANCHLLTALLFPQLQAALAALGSAALMA